MKGALSLEFIGVNTYDAVRNFDRSLSILGAVKTSPEDRIQPRASVAEIYRDDDGAIRYKRLYGQRDYSRANSKGSRGVRVNFDLEQDKLYLVSSPTSWRNTDVFYAALTPAGEVVRLSADDAKEWLNNL